MSGSGGFEQSSAGIWWGGRDSSPAGGVWPLYRNCPFDGAEDGKRIGTVFCDREQWILQWGVDENGQELPDILAEGETEVYDQVLCIELRPDGHLTTWLPDEPWRRHRQ
jgi:hypothetical protein